MARGRVSAPLAEAREKITQSLFRQLSATRSATDRERLFTRLVEVNLVLCDTLARRYANRGQDAEDLVQVARAGLVCALRRYRPERGCFTVFAVPTITGEIKRFFRDYGWMVRPPRRIQQLRALSQRRRGVAEQERQRALTIDELSDDLGVDARALEECEVASGGYVPVSVAEGLGCEDHDLEMVADLVSLRSALRKLTARERTILTWRFFDGCTQSQIGERLGVSQMQVSRILSRILARARSLLDPSTLVA